MPTLNIGKVRYVWRGTWDRTASYDILDRVRDDAGFVFEAIKAVPAGVVLTNENYWIKLSVQGPQGDKGDTGNEGPKGDTGEAPTAILYTPQENLTDEQQGQARANIGWDRGFTASFAPAADAYLIPILEELILENGGTQQEIDDIKNSETSGS